jgi:dCMP deaminase
MIDLREYMKTNFPNEKWDRFYLGLAKYYASASKDPSTKVGAVLVSPTNNVVGLGYNDFPPGVQDLDERYNDRTQKYALVTHAEINSILAAGHLAFNSTLYVCCKVAITAGVKTIVGFVADENDERAIRWKDSIAIAKMMCDEAGIGYRGIKE